jgi:hypothetical protein
MLHGRLFAIALTSKLRTELIQSKRLPVPVDLGSFPRSCLNRAVCGACEALHVPLGSELDEPGSQLSGSLLDRREDHSPTTFHSVAAQEPATSRDHARNEQEEEGGDQDRTEPDGRQQAGQQEPDSGERKNARAQRLPIDRPAERSRPRD